ncbi:MAG: glycosyltransferase family 4 protein [Anaerolineaceae bacterium]|nr:glycosyltransferase family 4 protein [Anaerolineaceae bacterium]
MAPRNLLWFNLATDRDDPVLAFTLSWLNAAAAHFDHIDVITMRAGSLDLAENITIHSLGKESDASKAQQFLRFYRHFLPGLRRRNYVGCFAHMQPRLASLAGPFLRWKAVPMILWYAHGNVPWHLRLAERWVSQIFTPTAESCRLASEKIQVVGHGIDTDHFQPAPLTTEPETNPFTIVYAGRIDPIKRMEMLFSALDHLSAQAHFPWQMLIVGVASPGQEEYELRLRREAKRRFGERVRFSGARHYQDMPDIYQTADVLWSASATGSLDKVLLEAMACGLPIVTNSEAAVELLPPPADEWLIPVGLDDRAAALHFAEKTIQLQRQTPSKRRELSQQLRSVVVENHNLSVLAQTIAEAFSR